MNASPVLVIKASRFEGLIWGFVPISLFVGGKSSCDDSFVASSCDDSFAASDKLLDVVEDVLLVQGSDPQSIRTL